MRSVPRSTFIEAVENGLYTAMSAVNTDVPDDDIDRLREVAATAQRSVSGDFFREGCCCPLVQAGVVTRESLSDAFALPSWIGHFYDGYDGAMRKLTGACGAFEVTDA